MTPRDERSAPEAELDAVQLLGEPTRRAVFDCVRAAVEPVTRDAVAAAVGISRRLAAFHLDRLADAGLLTVDYARPPGARGPGAGRPAKRYLAAQREVAASFPPRRYELAARILAAAAAQEEAGPRDAGQEHEHRLADRARDVALREGVRVGAAHDCPRRAASPADALTCTAEVLRDLGYRPESDGDGCLRLRNCPFHGIVDIAPGLVCGVNQALISGVVEGLHGESSLRAALDGVPPDCCVTVRAVST
jgi:predicted ArsR family transcriptional regulator